MASHERFGYEWKKWNVPTIHEKGQFLKWIYPLTESDLDGKSVLEVGCGNGTNCVRLLEAGAKKVVGIDYDTRTVSVAKKNLASFGGRGRALFMSAYDMSYKNQFDIVISIGVIHHLENPERVISNMVRAAKPGGIILIWVYGYEGNEWIVKYVDPFRKYFTSRMPLWLLSQLSHVPSVPLYVYAKLVPQNKSYMKQLAGFNYGHVRFIVFDQLVPRVANYWKRAEVKELFRRESVDALQIFSVNDCSWTAICKKR